MGHTSCSRLCPDDAADMLPPSGPRLHRPRTCLPRDWSASAVRIFVSTVHLPTARYVALLRGPATMAGMPQRRRLRRPSQGERSVSPLALPRTLGRPGQAGPSGNGSTVKPGSYASARWSASVSWCGRATPMHSRHQLMRRRISDIAVASRPAPVDASRSAGGCHAQAS